MSIDERCEMCRWLYTCIGASHDADELPCWESNTEEEGDQS